MKEGLRVVGGQGEGGLGVVRDQEVKGSRVGQGQG